MVFGNPIHLKLVSRRNTTIVHFIHFQSVQNIPFNESCSVFIPTYPPHKKGPRLTPGTFKSLSVFRGLQATEQSIQELSQRCENGCGHLLSFSEGKRLLYFIYWFSAIPATPVAASYLHKDNSHMSYYNHSFYSLSTSSFKVFKIEKGHSQTKNDP